MSSDGKKEIQPLSAWQAQLLRLTAFYDTKADFNLRELWSALNNDVAERETRKPKEGVTAFEGSVEHAKFVLSCSPIVIDMRLQLPSGAPLEAGGIPTIGRFETRCAEFIDFSKKLLEAEALPAIQRLAVGATIFFPVGNDRIQGYEQLIPYLPDVKIDPVNSSDFQYRINRRRKSTLKIPSLRINRLTTWRVSGYKTTLVPTADGATNAIVSDTAYACALELDINTVPEFPENLPKAKCGDILNELVALGKEIAAKGDIR